MAEMARMIVARLRAFFADRRRAKRCRVRLPFRVSVIGQQLNSNGTRRPPAIDGHTLDLSTSGLALVVPAIRVGEHYLVGENRELMIQLELPGGPVAMQAIPIRYERLEEEGKESAYLIGVRIAEINEPDRARYNEYIGRLLQE